METHVSGRLATRQSKSSPDLKQVFFMSRPLSLKGAVTPTTRCTEEDLRTSDPQDLRTSDPQTLKTSDPQDLRSSGPEDLRTSDPQDLRTSDPLPAPQFCHPTDQVTADGGDGQSSH